MNASDARSTFLVLASRRSFESLVGPVPGALARLFRFEKSRNAARIRALIPRCRMVISKNYARAETNRWIFAARRAGVPTLLLVDGPLEWSNLHANPSLAYLPSSATSGLYAPIVHDAVATIGQAQADWIEARNVGRKIVSTSYANRRIRTDVARPTGRGRAKFDFLLTTARTPYFGDREERALHAALRDCAEALEAAGYRTLVRVFDDALRATIRSCAPSCRFDTKGSFRRALSRARCVIGTPSSVLLEAMWHDRPTALLHFREGPLFYRCGWLLDDRADWATRFASMCARDPRRMARQRDSLRTNLSDEDFFAFCERVARNELLEKPRPFDGPDRAFETAIAQTLHDRV